MKTLTGCQRRVLEFIKHYLKDNGYSPSVRDVARHFEISPKAGYDHIKALERKQIIRCGENRARSIEFLSSNDEERPKDIDVPIIGAVAAGTPLFAEENNEGTIRLSSDLLGSGSYFALRVRGDSMCNAGILDGDLAIIRHQNTADNGQIVVAWLSGAVTLKRYFRESYRIRLEAANPAFSPIYTQDVQLLGCLRHSVRSYAI